MLKKQKVLSWVFYFLNTTLWNKNVTAKYVYINNVLEQWKHSYDKKCPFKGVSGPELQNPSLISVQWGEKRIYQIKNNK